ncbi:MAG: hypothetical protein JJU00_12900 [Opitutales bacterium]|nr:hypothetical protein [Opitutales bacterium]
MSFLSSGAVRRVAGFLAGGACVLCADGAVPGFYVFEGVVRAADASFGDRVRPGWTFSGALEAPVELSGAPLAFEYTLDRDHLLEWEGAQLADTPAETGVVDEAWRYLRVPVQHADAVTGEVPLGWVELWVPLDTANRGEAETGFFVISVWEASNGVFGEVSGTLSHFSVGDPAGDLEERVGLLEAWVADLSVENEELIAERDRLRDETAALRERIGGLEGMVDYLLDEKETLRERAERAGREAALRSDSELADLRTRLAGKTAAAALLEQENDFLRGESFRMADSLAVCEAENLRLRSHLERLERENASLRPAGRTTAPDSMPSSLSPAPVWEQTERPRGETSAPVDNREATQPEPEEYREATVTGESPAAPPRSSLRRGSRRR